MSFLRDRIIVPNKNQQKQLEALSEKMRVLRKTGVSYKSDQYQALIGQYNQVLRTCEVKAW